MKGRRCVLEKPCNPWELVRNAEWYGQEHLKSMGMEDEPWMDLQSLITWGTLGAFCLGKLGSDMKGEDRYYGQGLVLDKRSARGTDKKKGNGLNCTDPHIHCPSAYKQKSLFFCLVTIPLTLIKTRHRMFTKFWTLELSNLGISKHLPYCSDISLYLVGKI